MERFKEMPNVESLEDALGIFAEIIEEERNANWLKGDIALKAVEAFGNEIIGKLAEVAHCSKNKIYHLLYVSKAFPPEKRALDYNWSYHLQVAYKARALGMEPEELLEKAISEGWTQRDVKNYMSDKISIVKSDFECPDCKIEFTVKAEKEKSGTRIFCPICNSALGRI